jgi:DNA-binding XRE family transcriptional regulator
MTLTATTPLATRLRELRGERSQSQMANLVGTGQNRVCDWETGKHLPTLPVLVRYAQVCHTTVSDILRGVL